MDILSSNAWMQTLLTLTVFIMCWCVGYYVLVYLQGHFLHCINTRQQEMLCYSLFFSGKTPFSSASLSSAAVSACSLRQHMCRWIFCVNKYTPAYSLSSTWRSWCELRAAVSVSWYRSAACRGTAYLSAGARQREDQRCPAQLWLPAADPAIRHMFQVRLLRVMCMQKWNERLFFCASSYRDNSLNSHHQTQDKINIFNYIKVLKSRILSWSVSGSRLW